MRNPQVGQWFDEEEGIIDANLYRFNKNNPTNLVDPSGLTGVPVQTLAPVIPAEGGLAMTPGFYNWSQTTRNQPGVITLTVNDLLNLVGAGYPSLTVPGMEEAFMKWYKKEKGRGLGWTTDLPKPPNRLEKTIIDVPAGPLSQGPGFRYINWKVPAGWKYDFGVHYLGGRYHPGAAVGIRKLGPDGESGTQATYDYDGNIITEGLGAGTADLISPEDSGTGHRNVDVIPFEWAYDLDKHHGGQKYRNMYIEVRPPTVRPDAPRNRKP